jgi:hypothetical protein
LHSPALRITWACPARLSLPEARLAAKEADGAEVVAAFLAAVADFPVVAVAGFEVAVADL